jgi:hypothetical protein
MGKKAAMVDGAKERLYIRAQLVADVLLQQVNTDVSVKWEPLTVTYHAQFIIVAKISQSDDSMKNRCEAWIILGIPG